MTPSSFLKDDCGASLVEYAVALIVVILVGGILFALGNDISLVINESAGAF